MTPRPFPTLNLRTDTFTEQEREDFLAWYESTHGNGAGELIGFVPFMVEHDPGGFKRFRRHVEAAIGPGHDDSMPRAASPLIWFHTYIQIGNGRGAAYEASAAQRFGASKQLIMDTLRIATAASGPLAWNAIAPAVDGALRSLQDEGEGAPITWPAGWHADPDAFRSGIDLGRDDLDDTEQRSLTRWYEEHYGGVPASVRLLQDRNPSALKAQRNRFERCLGPSIPIELAALMVLHHAAMVRSRAGTRSALALAQSFGVSRNHIIDVLTWTTLNAGPSALDDAIEADDGYFE